MAQIHPPRYVSVKAAGEMVGLSSWTIKKRCDAQQIKSHFEGRKRLVDVSSLLAYVAGLPTARPECETA